VSEHSEALVTESVDIDDLKSKSAVSPSPSIDPNSAIRMKPGQKLTDLSSFRNEFKKRKLDVSAQANEASIMRVDPVVLQQQANEIIE